MRNKSETIWKPIWVELLSKCKKRVFLFDLDGTVWDDLLVVLNEAFGPVDAAGEKVWKQYDRAFKVLGTMTNGAHLEAEYRDLLTEKTLEEIHDWLKVNHRLVPGIKEFLKFLADNDTTAIAVSNGAYQIADLMLTHHDVVMPRVCNSLVMEEGKFVALDFFHDEHEGIRKGDLATVAAELGHTVVGCAGDSKGDLSLAVDTAKLGGIVLAVNKNGLSAWCEANEDQVGGASGWFHVMDYVDAIPVVAARLGSLS